MLPVSELCEPAARVKFRSLANEITSSKEFLNSLLLASSVATSRILEISRAWLPCVCRFAARLTGLQPGVFIPTDTEPINSARSRSERFMPSVARSTMCLTLLAA